MNFAEVGHSGSPHFKTSLSGHVGLSFVLAFTPNTPGLALVAWTLAVVHHRSLLQGLRDVECIRTPSRHVRRQAVDHLAEIVERFGARPTFGLRLEPARDRLLNNILEQLRI